MLTPTGTPGVAQRADRPQPARGRRGARLERARELGIERRDRDGRHHLPALGHRREQIEITLDQRRLRDRGKRLTMVMHHLDHLPRDQPFALDRLIRVRIHAERDRLGHVARLREFAREQLRGIHLRVDPALEIEPRRQPEIAVRRPREAVNAAVLAAAIRIQRYIERNVGRRIAREDRPGALLEHLRAQRRARLAVVVARPAVVDRLALDALVAPLQVAHRAAPLAGRGRHHRVFDVVSFAHRASGTRPAPPMTKPPITV